MEFHVSQILVPQSDELYTKLNFLQNEINALKAATVECDDENVAADNNKTDKKSTKVNDSTCETKTNSNTNKDQHHR